MIEQIHHGSIFHPLTWTQSTLKHIFPFAFITFLNLDSRASKTFLELDLLGLSNFISLCALGSQRLISPLTHSTLQIWSHKIFLALSGPVLLNRIRSSSFFNWTIIITTCWPSWSFSYTIFYISSLPLHLSL